VCVFCVKSTVVTAQVCFAGLASKRDLEIYSFTWRYVTDFHH
jgi:hypothetical protein